MTMQTPQCTTSGVKPISRLLLAVVAAVFGLAFGAVQASAASAPLVITYEKTCDELAGHCEGSANGVTIKMDITGYRGTGKAAKLTMTEEITVGTLWFKAELSGTASPAGFIVLNGTVTEGSFAGAEVHQRSNFVGLVGGDPNTTAWIGELHLMPASA